MAGGDPRMECAATTAGQELVSVPGGTASEAATSGEGNLIVGCDENFWCASARAVAVGRSREEGAGRLLARMCGVLNLAEKRSSRTAGFSSAVRSWGMSTADCMTAGV